MVARERQGHHAQAYCSKLYRVSKHQIRRGRGAARSSTSQGSAEPLCDSNSDSLESKARTGRVLRRKLISDHGLFSFYEGQQVTANGQYSRDDFHVRTKLLDTGLARRHHKLKAYTIMNLGVSIFLTSA